MSIDWLPPIDPTRLSLFRVLFRTQDKDRFFDLLAGIRPEDNKIQRIEPYSDIYRVDVVINDEELAFLKLAMPKFSESWLQMWDKNDRY